MNILNRWLVMKTVEVDSSSLIVDYCCLTNNCKVSVCFQMLFQTILRQWLLDRFTSCVEMNVACLNP